MDAAAAVAEALGRRPETGVAREFSSFPSRRIPDNDPRGIRDEIGVSEAGRIEAVKVTVDIDHTWIGDLRLLLASPAGSRVLLHDRSGSSRDDIHATYDSTTTPALAGLIGETATGTWSLLVEDRASRDVGVLNSWTLNLNLSPSGVIVEDSEAVTIPDNDPNGITRQLTVEGNPAIADLAVSVDITHPWIGDLLVTLTPPAGDPVVLHNQQGGLADNIVKTWRAATLSGLQALIGENAGGPWQLRVADRASHNGFTARQVLNPRSAAASARSRSAGEAWGRTPNTFSVAGLITSSDSPVLPWHHSPSI